MTDLKPRYTYRASSRGEDPNRVIFLGYDDSATASRRRNRWRHLAPGMGNVSRVSICRPFRVSEREGESIMTDLKPRYRYKGSDARGDPPAPIFLGYCDEWDVYTDGKTYLFTTRRNDVPPNRRTIEEAGSYRDYSTWGQAWSLYHDYQQYDDPSVSPNARPAVRSG